MLIRGVGRRGYYLIYLIYYKERVGLKGGACTGVLPSKYNTISYIYIVQNKTSSYLSTYCKQKGSKGLDEPPFKSGINNS